MGARFRDDASAVPGRFPRSYDYGFGMSSDAHGATVPAAHGLHHPYHLVNPSPWPIVGALGGFCTVLGIIFAAHFGSYLVLTLGAVLVLGTMFFWWSEVMFFVAFCGPYCSFALFRDVQANDQTVWPPSTITTFDPFHLPILN